MVAVEADLGKGSDNLADPNTVKKSLALLENDPSVNFVSKIMSVEKGEEMCYSVHWDDIY